MTNNPIAFDYVRSGDYLTALGVLVGLITLVVGIFGVAYPTITNWKLKKEVDDEIQRFRKHSQEGREAIISDVKAVNLEAEKALSELSNISVKGNSDTDLANSNRDNAITENQEAAAKLSLQDIQNSIKEHLDKHFTSAQIFAAGYEANELGEWIQAIHFYWKFNQVTDHRSSTGLNNLGLAYHNLCKDTNRIKSTAYAHFQEAIQTDPSNLIAHLNLADFHLYNNELSEALECFDNAHRLRPEDAHIINNKGVVLERMGEFEGAITMYKKALSIDPSNYLFKGNISGALILLTRIAEALPMIQEEEAISPSTNSMKLLAYIDFLTDKDDEAMKKLDIAYNRNKTLSNRKSFLAQIVEVDAPVALKAYPEKTDTIERLKLWAKAEFEVLYENQDI